MKILQINTVYGEGSTGKIAKDIHDICKKNNIDCLSAYRCKSNADSSFQDSIEISSALDSKIHGYLSRLTMFKGCFSYFKTRKFIKTVKAYSPDIIHLHNLHGSYINIPLLFKYINKTDTPVVWTFHDCWPFTAICSHFTLSGCEKWKEGCHNCPKKKELSLSLIDLTRKVWSMKKKWFTSLNNLTIVTPSHWLEDTVKQSFLGSYPVKVINNGIDTEIFCYRDSDFREKHNLMDKKIVLGVTFGWGYSKGLDVFIKLAETLPEDYKIVLVGTNTTVDEQIPSNIITIHKTANQQQLADIYSSADVFVNPTREDTYPTVNLESIACMTPVITFKTGGSPESVDESVGAVVDTDDINSLRSEVIRICKDKPFKNESFLEKAESFKRHLMAEKYLKLYKEIIK